MLFKKTIICVILCGSFLLCTFVPNVMAIVPQVQEVTFLNSGDDTLLEVTFFHTPVTAFHYVNEVEVDIHGAITTYQISQDSTTFTAQINLGQVTGNPFVRARAHCIVDGWSSWSNQITIPEFPLWFILPLLMIGTLIAVVARKSGFWIHCSNS